MERRFALFLVLAVLIVIANALVSALFFPPKPQPVAQEKDAQAAAEKEAGKKKPAKARAPVEEEEESAEDDADKAQADRKADADLAPSDGDLAKSDQAEAVADDRQPADDRNPADKNAPADKAAGEGAAGDKAATEKVDGPFPERRISLGSYDPDSGFRLLVTLNAAGAAVERVEMNSPRYRELEDRSGYIGHLAPADSSKPPGARLQVVGRDTPAAAAGLQTGDVISQFGDKSIGSAAEFELELKKTEAGHTVALAGERDGQPLAMDVRLGRRPLEIIRPEFESKPLEVPSGPHDPLSLLLTIEQIGKRRLGKNAKELKGVDLIGGNWEVVESTDDRVVFRRRLPKLGLEITKRYELAKVQAADEDPDSAAYHLTFDVGIRNTADSAQGVAYRLDGPTGLPLEGAWYATKISHTWGSAGMRDVILRFNGSGKAAIQESCANIVDAKEGKIQVRSETMEPLDFIAVDTQYFAAAMLPRKTDPNDTWLDEIRPLRVGAIPTEKADKKLTDVSFRLISKEFELEPGASLEHRYDLFAGPKKPSLLDRYTCGDASLGELVYYGWFGWVAKPMLALLHTFYRLVHNYGIAIIMLTVLVRGCMFPLSRKQALSAQKMQELRPEIQRITEKYKKPEERTRAQQELFRKHKYNPFGGCLLVFVQLPIFVGLYRSLMVDVELRQAPLISDAIRWASNLAAPDMFYDWSAWMPAFVIGYLGPYLNIFPLITIGLMIWQQKMFLPPPADEQAALQQKMMSYMMIFMGVMFFKVACGLCLYFIASSLWGITERKLLPKSTPPGQPGTAVVASSPGDRSDGNGSTKRKKRQPGRK